MGNSITEVWNSRMWTSSCANFRSNWTMEELLMPSQ